MQGPSHTLPPHSPITALWVGTSYLPNSPGGEIGTHSLDGLIYGGHASTWCLLAALELPSFLSEDGEVVLISVYIFKEKKT